MSELALALDLRAELETPLYRQVYAQIRMAILTGRVRSHQKLPSSRQLAKSLGLSRTTVTQSYDQLISEGYLQTRQGAGTFVCAQIPDELLTLPEQRTSDEPTDCLTSGLTSGLTGPLQPELPALSTYGDRLSHTADFTYEKDCPLSFRYGLPDMSLFPIQQWRRLLSRQHSASTEWMDYSAAPTGHAPLREQIARYISQVRAVRCTPEQILITNGTQQALDLAVRVLINPGEAIAIENPGYLSGRRIFRAGGASLLPVAVDAEGIKIEGPDGLVQMAANQPLKRMPKLVYVTPSHQFPTGVLMSLSRRLALLQWAQQNNALIIEDDYDSEFRYSGRPIPALQGLDTSDRVLYMGTFSKLMFPGLRIGYVVLPVPLIPLFQRAKWLCDRQGALIDHFALADFIGEGHLAKHIRRMRTVYEGRRQVLVSELKNISENAKTLNGGMRQSAEILGDEAGLHVVARLPSQKSVPNVIEQARVQGVSLFSTRPYYWHPPHSPEDQPHDVPPLKPVNSEFIFGFGAINEAEIKTAIARIQPLL
ncbi:MAG: PLP-dependent aminotransferase family protein [Phormidesmis sp.]